MSSVVSENQAKLILIQFLGNYLTTLVKFLCCVVLNWEAMDVRVLVHRFICSYKANHVWSS